MLVVSGVSDDDVLDILGADYDASDAYPGAAAVRKLAEEHTNIDLVFASDVDGLATLETLENWAGAPVVVSSPGAGRTSLASVAFDLTNGAVVQVPRPSRLGRQMNVVVPPGIQPGQKMSIQAPTGTIVTITVPPNMRPGAMLTVGY